MTIATLIGSVLAFAATVLAMRALLAPLVLLPGQRTSSADSTLDTLKRRVAAAITEGKHFDSLVPRVQRDLARAGREREKAIEWLATATVTAGGLFAVLSVLVLLALIRSSIITAIITAVLVGGMAAVAAFTFLLSGLSSEAENRTRRIVRVLPYGIELIILVAESGGSLEDGMNAIISSLPREPLSQEFARVLAERQIGRPLAEAFSAMDERLKAKEITQLVTTIEIGRELGTPTAASLASFAEWLRVKRILDGEKLAREAAPKMAFPNTLIMVANVLLILAPFIPALTTLGGL